MEVRLPKCEGVTAIYKYVNGDWVKYKPVIKSKWNYDGTCDNCKAHILSNYTNFCPACGADMRECGTNVDVPVAHAKWVLVQNGKGCCSNCNRLDYIDNLATHCRYCGAIMDGDV